MLLSAGQDRRGQDKTGHDRTVFKDKNRRVSYDDRKHQIILKGRRKAHGETDGERAKKREI